MPIPDTMQAITLAQTGDPDVLTPTTLATPRPQAGEVLIRVQAAGVNRADVAQRRGVYPVATGDHPVPGLEVAGDIVAVGDGVTGHAVGDRVCTLVEGGGYAEYVAVPAVKSMRWPQGYDATLAAALPEAFFTAWANVFQAGQLQSGETLLVHGGRGGVGTAAIGMARAFGATTIATSGSDTGCRDCLELGADHAINYRTQDIAATGRTLTDDAGVDVILDHLGAPGLPNNLQALAMDGRLVIIGFTGGSTVEQLDLTPILTRRLVVTGSAMRPRSAAEKGGIASELAEHVWPLLDRGDLMPSIAATFALSDAADAHRFMEEGNYLGKVVLTVA